jgi:DNA primase
MKVKNYELVKEQIRSFLPQYLVSQGIKKTTSFKCIAPTHEDKNASSGVMADGTHFHCLGCHVTGDIFDAAHLIENKPNFGPEFITENLTYLAELFHVEVEKTDITPEEALEIDTYRAYTKASALLSEELKVATKHKTFASVQKHMTERAWEFSPSSPDLWDKSGLGWCPDAAWLVSKLSHLGFDSAFLHNIALDRTDIFNAKNLIFTIRDHFGRPVGFAARDCTWTPEAETSKYVNTPNHVAIYQKHKRLYNLHNALKTTKSSKPLYIMEGYPNVVTAMKHGMDNCIAIGGTALTADHVILLREMGISHIILCMDGDKAGQESIEWILDERLAGCDDINIKIVIIPNQLDPDEFIRAEGIEAFNKLAQWSAFEWRLLRFPENEEAENICKLMIPLIVGEISYITQEKMCETLAKHTGIPVKAIRSELERLKSAKERKLAQERAVILDALKRKIEINPTEAETFITEAATDLQKLSEKYDTDKLSPESSLKLLDDQKVCEENKTGEFAGFRLGHDLIALEECLAGEWKKDVLLCFGGKANSGKTSLLAKMSVAIAENKENNAICIFHTIDDTAAQFLAKWICIAESSRKLTINEVRDPVYYQQAGVEDIFTRRSIGYQRIRELIRESRLILKDANDGASLSYCESLIRYYRDRYPDRKIVYFLDNMHKLQEFGVSPGEERAKFRSISERCKNIATRYHVAMICTVEYTKLGQGIKPTNYNIAETVQIEYDSNFIAHLYNEAHEFGEEEAEKKGMTHNVHMKGIVKRYPVIELSIGKNKITDFKNRIYLDFYPASSDFVTRNSSEVEMIIENKKKEEQGEKAKIKKSMTF